MQNYPVGKELKVHCLLFRNAGIWWMIDYIYNGALFWNSVSAIQNLCHACVVHVFTVWMNLAIKWVHSQGMFLWRNRGKGSGKIPPSPTRVFSLTDQHEKYLGSLQQRHSDNKQMVSCSNTISSISYQSYDLNSHKLSTPFLGHRQTMQTQIRHHRMRRLIRVYTVGH